MTAKGIGSLDRDKYASRDPEQRRLHFWLIHYRDQAAAHTDEASGRGITNTRALLGEPGERWAEHRYEIDEATLPRIIELAAQQDRRFNYEADQAHKEVPGRLAVGLPAARPVSAARRSAASLP